MNHEAKAREFLAAHDKLCWGDLECRGDRRGCDCDAVVAALAALLAEVGGEAERERDEAIANARRIAETNLHADAAYRGAMDGAEILRSEINELASLLREPTAAMIEAGVLYRLNTSIHGGNPWSADTAELWRVMAAASGSPAAPSRDATAPAARL